MKAITITAMLALSVPAVQAQIIISPYPKEIKCDVDGVMDLPIPEARSSAGEVTVKTDEEIFSGGCLGTLVRTYHFTDPAGNKAEAQQFISLTDNQPPMLYGEAPDISTTEEMIPEPPTFASRDNSGKNCDVIFTEKKEDHRIVRTWTCTDVCGNSSSKQQVITIE